MKTALFFFSSFFLFSVQAAYACGKDSSDDKRPYPYEQAIVEYKYAGSFEGRQTLYFRNSGRTFSVKDDYVIPNTPLHTHIQQAFINTPEHFYYTNLADKRGYVIDCRDFKKMRTQVILMDLATIGIDSTMHKNGYTQGDSQFVLEKKCQVYVSSDSMSKFCFWKGILMKMAIKYGNFAYTLEAVSIDENADVADDNFSPPSDIKLMDYEQYIKSQTKGKL